MFANLKNKLMEEVKIPTKFQQLANAAQAAVSSSNSTTASNTDTNTNSTNESAFFSIAEEDTPQNSPSKSSPLQPGAAGRAATPAGVPTRTRRLSNSSMASDISFRLPSYEPPVFNHLQSDIDASGSEMDEPTSKAALTAVSKEQLYNAYRKSLERCHKYRAQYTALINKYRDLERDSTKARSVLVETQEKALRRVNELREQCSLEQQAKAHLEEALRIEMDDMNCKLTAYQTKLKLLGENPDNITTDVIGKQSANVDVLIDFGGDKVADGLSESSLQKIVKGLQLQLAERETQMRELQQKYDASQIAVEALKKQEEDNSLLLAQTKQAIHTELDNKEAQVKKLQGEIGKLEINLVEAKAQEVERSASLLEQLRVLKESKQEAEAKVIATEHLMAVLKTEFAANEQTLKTTKEKLAHLEKEASIDGTEISQLKQQLAESEERCNNALKRLEAEHETKTRNDELEGNLRLQDQRVKLLENELSRLRQEERQSESSALEDLQTELMELKTIVAAKDLTINDYREEQKKLLNDLKRLGDSLLEREDRLKTQIEHEENLKREYVENLDSLKKELREVGDSHINLRNLNSSLDSKMQQLQEKLKANDAGARMQILETENLALLERKAELETELAVLRKELNDAEISKSAAADKEGELQDKLQAAVAENLEVQSSKLLADSNIESLLERVAVLEEKTQQAENSLKDAVTELDARTKENNALLSELQDLKQSAEITLSQLAQFESERDNLQTQLSELKDSQAEFAQHKSLLEQAQERNTELHAQLSELKALLQQFERTEAEMTSLREQLAKVQRELEIQVSDNHELEAKLAVAEAAKAEMQMFEEQLKIAQRRADDLTALQEEQKRQVDEYSLKLAELEAGMAKEQAQHAAELGKRTAVEEQIREEMVTLTEKCRIADSDVERVHETNDALELAMAQLRNSHELQLGELQRTLADREEKMTRIAGDAEKLHKYENVMLEFEQSQQRAAILQAELDEAKQAVASLSTENVDSKEKLKSMQCELYVLRENAAQFEMQTQKSDMRFEKLQAELSTVGDALAEQKLELARKTEHANFVNLQNDAIQEELLRAQKQLQDTKDDAQSAKDAEEQKRIELEQRLQNVEAEKTKLDAENNQIRNEIRAKIDEYEALRVELVEQAEIRKVEQDAQKVAPGSEAEHLRAMNEELQRELEDLKYKSNAEMSNLEQELEELQNNNRHLNERLKELSAVAILENDGSAQGINELEDAGKLNEIMSEVQKTNTRNLFLEQKCENFERIEQSNERLRLQNEKLSRQLDETLISLERNDGIPVNTEFEYLRNIMFQYLTGNTNNETLVKVISAVLKFSPQQAQVALEKEHQRRSLLNKII